MAKRHTTIGAALLALLVCSCGEAVLPTEDGGQPDGAVYVDVVRDVDVWPDVPSMCKDAYRTWMVWGQYHGYADNCTLDDVMLWMQERECTHAECEETEYYGRRATIDNAPTTWGYCDHRCCPLLTGGPCSYKP
jgi:hypothetical protein